MRGAQLMYNFNLTLYLYIYTKPWHRIYGLCGKEREPGCSHAVLGLPLEMSAVNKKTVHGPPVQSRVAAAYRAVPAARAMILPHMVMNRRKGNRGSRHGAKAKASRQGMARPL